MGDTRTIGDVIARIFGAWAHSEIDEDVDEICAALGLDPATVIDGPLVVLHPGEYVVRWKHEGLEAGDTTLAGYGRTWTHKHSDGGTAQWVVVASNPQEKTP